MPRKKQPEQSGEFSQLEGQTVPMVSGAGNLSEADLAAIRGVPPDAEPMTATEAALRASEAGAPGADATVAMAARMLTLEGRMDDLEKAMESWAKQMRTGLRHQMDTPAPTHPATSEEESAYARTNLALMQQNQTQYDGIQAWRNAGSPRLEPKEKKAA